MSFQLPASCRFTVAFAVGAAFSITAFAHQGELPRSLAHPEQVAHDVPIFPVAPMDAAARRAELDSDASLRGVQTKRLRVADERTVSLQPVRDGSREILDDGSTLWRFAVRAAGATDLRLGFTRFALPDGASLHVIGADGYYQGPYHADDATSDGSFRSPVVPGDTATVELHLPQDAEAEPGSVELGSVGAGFRDLFRREDLAKFTGPDTSGRCNINVVCPLGEPYSNESRALAYYEFESLDGIFICTGTLVADVPRNFRNYLLTAAHCVSTAAEARSMRMYWNYRSSACNGTSGWTLDDNQFGAQLRATRADADFTLVELEDAPDPAWNLYYAGWDASGAVPARTIGLHHPNGDMAKVTAGPRPTTMNNCIGTGSSQQTHWKTGPYNDGTTEGGSSGSGLFVPVGDASGHDRLLIGVLSGGTAACSLSSPTRPDGGFDCYGKLASAWNGPGPASRLRDWLDPGATGTLTAEGGEPPSDGPSPTSPPLANRAAAVRDAHTRTPASPRPIPLPPPRTGAQHQR